MVAHNHIDMAGQSYGRLTVLSPAGTSADRKGLWLCRCSCGNETTTQGRYLRKGLTRSCGCLKDEAIASLRATHRMSSTPTYGSWSSMLSRCYNPKQQCYAKYGAKGVTVCDRWREGFAAFFEDMGERPAGKTLERRNPFGNYEPSNCCWATPTQQNRNRRADWAIAIIESLLARGVITRAEFENVRMASP